MTNPNLSDVCGSGSKEPLPFPVLEIVPKLKMNVVDKKVQVRGIKFFAFDVDARPIHVGDTLEWVETSGPYGQTISGRGKVTDEKLTYGSIVTDGGLVNTHWEWKPNDGPEGLYCRHENHTYDHGHKTWARVVVSC